MNLKRFELNLRRPEIKRPAIRRPNIEMKSVDLPKPVGDLVADLRDRGLMPVVLALLAALVMVPVMLGGGDETVPGIGDPLAATEGAEAVSPAVLAESEATVRDFARRLGKGGKDPFNQKFLIPNGSGSSLNSSGVPFSDQGSQPGTNPSPAGSGNVTSQDHGGIPMVFLAPRVDVRIGPLGDLEARNGVQQLEAVPSSSQPVAIFVGSDQEAKRALFLMSSDVGPTSGDGSCSPSPANCQFLTLREGEVQEFTYTPKAETWRLRVAKVYFKKLG